MVHELFRRGLPEAGLTPKERRSVALGLVILALLVAAGLFGVVRLAEQGRERDLESWRVRMGLVAESRASAIRDWLDRHNQIVREIADNTSARLYVSELSLTGVAAGGSAQRQYLENLLEVSATRAGFVASGGGNTVPANVDMERSAGIAIFTANYGGNDDASSARASSVIATTRSMPDVRDILGTRSSDAPGMVMLDSEEKTLVVFLAPVHGVQSDTSSDAPMAWVVAAKPIGADLFQLLRQPGEVARSGETYLVHVSEGRVAHLSPLEGLREGERPSDMLAEDGAALFAAETPIGMGVVKNYAGVRVLAVGRPISDLLGWTLVRTVSAEEALAEIESRRNAMLLVLGISVIAAGALVLLVWRHGASVRAATAARRIALAANEYERLSGFLEVVTNSQPTRILVIDDEGIIQMSNLTAAEDAGMTAEAMRGKSLAAVYGGEVSRALLAAAKTALKEDPGAKGGGATTVTLDDTMDQRYLKADLVRLDLAAATDGDKAEAGAERIGATLIVIEDLSELMAARARRESSLKSLVQVLVALIDARDPYSAHHSARVSEIAGLIAAAMQLDPVTIETAETAGALLNLGKLTVSKDILTRPDNLSVDEIETVRNSMMRSADLIDDLEFDGPVAETLMQMQAHWDGSGRPNIKGEDILITARVLAVSNGFIAMISPRAHRPGMSLDDTVHALLAGTEKIYDRRVVAALIHHLENAGGRDRWERLAETEDRVLAPVD